MVEEWSGENRTNWTGGTATGLGFANSLCSVLWSWIPQTILSHNMSLIMSPNLQSSDSLFSSARYAATDSLCLAHVGIETEVLYGQWWLRGLMCCYELQQLSNWNFWWFLQYSQTSEKSVSCGATHSQNNSPLLVVITDHVCCKVKSEAFLIGYPVLSCCVEWSDGSVTLLGHSER